MAADSSYTQAPKGKRFTETVKFFPVAFVLVNIASLYSIYMFCHALPLLEDAETKSKGVVELVLFNIVTALLVICYVLCILVHPGAIPEKEEDPRWEYVPQDKVHEEASVGINLQESKRSGDRRHCKWCAKFKPDRSHHCRVCRMCILKMDHHCPWIYNCVGFGNHKYFFLLLLYTVIDCHLITWTMLQSLSRAFDPKTPFILMFFILFGETLAGFFGIVVTMFFGFHIYLMLHSMTTIEFCEKKMKQRSNELSPYDRGIGGNIKAVLGDNMFTWLLPLDLPKGGGLTFLTEDMRITKDMEAGREFRRRVHKRGDNSATASRGRSYETSPSAFSNEPALPSDG